jgi:hypothetical protein
VLIVWWVVQTKAWQDYGSASAIRGTERVGQLSRIADDVGLAVH